jgi:radical SAM protein with 4Fe4S-binding SPASM domain
MKKYFDPKYKFFEIFDEKTGHHVRSSVLTKTDDGKLVATKYDPFMRSFPALLDIGVMGTCQHGQSGLCLQASNDCYQSGNKIKKPNMSVRDFEIIMEQCKNKLFQIALGGRGDVNKHEHFDRILEIANKYDVVPNYTTSGLDLTDDEVDLTKKYCGAVAVSWYRHQHTFDAVNKFIKADIKTNIHFVLSKNSIDEAVNLIKSDDWPDGINAVIFLLYKPIGEGKLENILTVDAPYVSDFFELINNFKGNYKIGFDSCSIPGLINFTDKIDTVFVDTCEGGRFSAYISADMRMVPCSFDQDFKWSVNLRTNTLLPKNSILHAWHSEKFNNFRSQLFNACELCNDRRECYGGCPIDRRIVLCDRSEQSYTK